MSKKVYDLKELSIVILAKMTFIKQPTCYKCGKYESKSIPGAFFAEKIPSTDRNVYRLVTKNKYYDDSPEDNLRKGSQFIIKEYDAGVVFELPILTTGKSNMSVAQLRKIERVWAQKGCITFNGIVDENKNLLKHEQE